MRVRLKPDRFYSAFTDPWSIGDARSPRYDHYRELVLTHATQRGRLLDIGCGYAAFLARFRSEYSELIGVDASQIAIEGARRRHPDIRFFHGSAAAPPAALGDARFDTVLLSDVIYYLPDRKRRAAMSWIARHLAPGGIALIAAWVPGGRYLTDDELIRLVDAHLVIEHSELLETGHLALIARPRRSMVVVTVDYETWQPIPDGRTIDWERDVFEPAAALIAAGTRAAVPITLMAEMGEYFWLARHEPALAERMRAQWRDAVQAGHDVQLHLHPNWLPELGARNEQGRWQWDPDYAIAADYPGDLGDLIGRCRAELEAAIQPVAPDYRASVFRAGTYEAQPFGRLHDALVANDIRCDSSVFPGSKRADRQYTYRHAHALSSAWRANRLDPQLRAPAAESGLLELPVCVVAPGVRWTFDADEGPRFARRLPEVGRATEAHRRGSTELYRRRRRLTRSSLLARWPGLRTLGRYLALPEARPTGDRFHVLVAHTKADLDLGAVERGLTAIGHAPGVETMTFSSAARVAAPRYPTLRPAAEPPSLGATCEELLARLMPIDRDPVVVLDGNVDRLRRSLPWATIARASIATEASAIVLPSGLERESDPDALLTVAVAGLSDDGVLLCRAWADGRAGWRAPSASPYSPTRDEFAARLEDAGLTDVEVREVDATRTCGLPYRPEAEGRLLLARAWRRPISRQQRVRALLDFVYHRLAPDQSASVHEPDAILAAGRAWCAGYAAVLTDALHREGFPARRATLIADDHPRGRGPTRRETHEVVEAWDGDRLCVLDPMAGVSFPHPLADLIRQPELARPDREADGRWSERGYDMYATEFLYRRLVAVGVRTDPTWPPRIVPARRVSAELLRPPRLAGLDYRPLPRTILRAWWAWHDAFAHAREPRRTSPRPYDCAPCAES